MKSKMTIGKKLFISSGAALVLTLVVSFVAMQSIGSLAGILSDVINKTAKKQYLACAIETGESDALAAERGIVVGTLTKETALVEKNNREFGQAIDGMKKKVSEFIPLIVADEVRRQIEDVQKGMDKMLQNHQQLYALAAGGKASEAAEFVRTTVAADADGVSTLTKGLVQFENRLMGDAEKSAEASVSESRWVATIIIGCSLLVACVVVFIVRQVNRNLRQAVTELSEGGERVASAASQVSSSSQSLAQGSSEQAASLEETSASSEEINSMARKNTENSRSAADLVTQSQQKFVRDERGAAADGGCHGGDQHAERQDLQDHQGDRRDRVSDEHPGAQCGGGSRAGRRSGHGLRGGRR